MGRSGWDEAVSMGGPTRFSGSLTPMMAIKARMIRSIMTAMVMITRSNDDRINGIDRSRSHVRGIGNRINRGRSGVNR